MKIDEAIKILENHNKWRLGADVQMINPKTLTEAINTVVEHYKNGSISEKNVLDYVDLGLPSGTLWAKKNVGAENETDYGLYFAWGETQGYSGITDSKSFSWDDYKWADESDALMTKYNSTDGKTLLEAEDDAAHVSMGGDWHMPTYEQCVELFKETKNGFVTSYGNFTQYAWSDSNGYSSPTQTTDTISGWNTAGYFFFKNTYTSVTDAITAEDYLFVPAAGICFEGLTLGVGKYGGFWSPFLYESSVSDAWDIGFYFSSAGVSSSYRYGGLSVRGVINKK